MEETVQDISSHSSSKLQWQRMTAPGNYLNVIFKSTTFIHLIFLNIRTFTPLALQALYLMHKQLNDPTTDKLEDGTFGGSGCHCNRDCILFELPFQENCH